MKKRKDQKLSKETTPVVRPDDGLGNGLGGEHRVMDWKGLLP